MEQLRDIPFQNQADYLSLKLQRVITVLMWFFTWIMSHSPEDFFSPYLGSWGTPPSSFDKWFQSHTWLWHSSIVLSFDLTWTNSVTKTVVLYWELGEATWNSPSGTEHKNDRMNTILMKNKKKPNRKSNNSRWDKTHSRKPFRRS